MGSARNLALVRSTLTPSSAEPLSAFRSAGLTRLAWGVPTPKRRPSPPAAASSGGPVVPPRGGLFAGHSGGDVVASNATSGGTLTFSLTAKGVSGLFFLGGHDIVITVSESVAVSMDLSSSTGAIDVTVPAGVVVAAAGISASVATGSVALTTTDAAFVSGSSLRAVSTTGSVTLSITQTVVHPGSVGVTGTSTTGGVSFTFNRAAGVAARVSSAVTTGTVNPDPAKYTGSSNALLFAPDEATYDAALMTFQVALQSTTGGIDLR